MFPRHFAPLSCRRQTKLRIDNRTPLPDELVRMVAEFARPDGLTLPKINLRVQRRKAGWDGLYAPRRIPSNTRIWVTLEPPPPGWRYRAPKIGPGVKNARGHSAFYQAVESHTYIETLVALLAHEMRHAWQAAWPWAGLSYNEPPPLYPGCPTLESLFQDEFHGRFTCTMVRPARLRPRGNEAILQMFDPRPTYKDHYLATSIERDADCYALHILRRWRREHDPAAVNAYLGHTPNLPWKAPPIPVSRKRAHG